MSGPSPGLRSPVAGLGLGLRLGLNKICLSFGLGLKLLGSAKPQPERRPRTHRNSFHRSIWHVWSEVCCGLLGPYCCYCSGIVVAMVAAVLPSLTHTHTHTDWNNIRDMAVARWAHLRQQLQRATSICLIMLHMHMCMCCNIGYWLIVPQDVPLGTSRTRAETSIRFTSWA